jgi:hypothetical protein
MDSFVFHSLVMNLNDIEVIKTYPQAGFGPGTVNMFRQLIGLEEVKWGEEYILNEDLETDDNYSKTNKRVVKTKQTSLSDFWK